MVRVVSLTSGFDHDLHYLISASRDSTLLSTVCSTILDSRLSVVPYEKSRRRACPALGGCHELPGVALQGGAG